MRQPIYSRTHKPMAIKLSVLIPTLKSRTESLSRLINELQYQAQGRPVQILWLGDNRSMTVGEKRNQLLQLAAGEWVAFVDDDDQVGDNYIKKLLIAIKDNPEKAVITFRGTHTKDDQQDLDFRYSLQFGRNIKTEIDGKRWHVMLPDHLCCWRKDRIVNNFPHKGLGEDHEFARKQAQTIQACDIIELTDYLYHYNYSSYLSECRR